MADGWLTTHALETARGCPAAGVRITLYRLAGPDRARPAEAVTNADGRTDAPLVPRGALRAGRHALLVQAGADLRGAGLAAAVPTFLDEVPMRFGIADPGDMIMCRCCCRPSAIRPIAGADG